MIQYFSRRLEITWPRPEWPNRLCAWRMSSVVTWLFCGKIPGCFVSWGKSARLSRPPTLRIPLSMKGTRRWIQLLLFILAFLSFCSFSLCELFSFTISLSACISSPKAEVWTNFRIANSAFTRSCTVRGQQVPLMSSRLAVSVVGGVPWPARFLETPSLTFTRSLHLICNVLLTCRNTATALLSWCQSEKWLINLFVAPHDWSMITALLEGTVVPFTSGSSSRTSLTVSGWWGHSLPGFHRNPGPWPTLLCNDSKSIQAPGCIVYWVLFRIHVPPLARRWMVPNQLNPVCNKHVKALLLNSNVSQHSCGVRMVHKLRIDVKYIWNNSFLNCDCRWKWRMIIAVNFPI